MIKIAVSSAILLPIHFLFAIVKEKDDSTDVKVIPNNILSFSEWGEPNSDDDFTTIDSRECVIHIVWLSILENRLYESKLLLNHREKPNNILIGCALYGRICIWQYDLKGSTILYYGKGRCIEDTIRNRIFGNYKVVVSENEVYDIDVFCDIFKRHINDAIGTIYLNSFDVDKLVQQFTYRYVAKFGKWNGKGKQWEEYGEKDRLPEFGWIEEALFDGTHDKLRDGRLMKYHEAGKPKKLAVSWHVGKSEYSAYFWFEDEGIREVFDRFYGAHPDTKTDVIIRIDAERRKYELALYRYGLKEPQVIPEDVYQLLVFKNKFEDYRSDNYNQERGAWIW